MANKSEMMSPENPSSPRRISVIITFESEAGNPSAAKFGVSICPTMTIGQSTSMPALNGTNSHASICSRVRMARTAPVCESPAVSPCPGKCFTHGSVPVLSMDSTSAATISAQTAGSLENARLPITVLAGLVSTSATGAKSTLNPICLRHVPIVEPTCSADEVSPEAPISAISGNFSTSKTPEFATRATRLPLSSSTVKNGLIPTATCAP